MGSNFSCIGKPSASNNRPEDNKPNKPNLPQVDKTIVYMDCIPEIRSFGKSIRTLHKFWIKNISEISAEEMDVLGCLTFFQFAHLLCEQGLSLQLLRTVNPKLLIRQIVPYISLVIDMFTVDVKHFGEGLRKIETVGQMHTDMGISPQTWLLFNQSFHYGMRNIFKEKYTFKINKQMTAVMEILSTMLMRSHCWKEQITIICPMRKLKHLKSIGHQFSAIAKFWAETVEKEDEEKQLQMSAEIIEKLKSKAKDRYLDAINDVMSDDTKNIIQSLTNFIRTIDCMYSEIIINTSDENISQETSEEGKKNIYIDDVNIEIEDNDNDEYLNSNNSSKLQRKRKRSKRADTMQNNLATYLQQLGAQMLSFHLTPIVLYEGLEILHDTLTDSYGEKYSTIGINFKKTATCIIHAITNGKTFIDPKIIEMTNFIQNHSKQLDTAISFSENLLCMSDKEIIKLTQGIIDTFKITAIGQCKHVKFMLEDISNNGLFMYAINGWISMIKKQDMQGIYLRSQLAKHPTQIVNHKIFVLMIKAMDSMFMNTFSKKYRYTWNTRKAVMTMFSLIYCIVTKSFTADLHITPEMYEKDPVSLVFYHLSEHFEVILHFFENNTISGDFKTVIVPQMEQDLCEAFEQIVSSEIQQSLDIQKLSCHLVDKSFFKVINKFNDPLAGDDVDGGNMLQYIRRMGRIATSFGFEPQMAPIFVIQILHSLKIIFNQQMSFTLIDSFEIVIAVITHFLLQQTPEQVCRLMNSAPNFKALRAINKRVV